MQQFEMTKVKAGKSNCAQAKRGWNGGIIIIGSAFDLKRKRQVERQ
jgi:hypothetical protein